MKQVLLLPKTKSLGPSVAKIEVATLFSSIRIQWQQAVVRPRRSSNLEGPEHCAVADSTNDRRDRRQMSTVHSLGPRWVGYPIFNSRQTHQNFGQTAKAYEL